MCGIAGVIHFAATTTTEIRELLDLMLSKLKHRGDEEHAYESIVLSHCALGCNRLAIVDRVHGYQPLTDSQDALIAILNGEIYNYQQLRDQLTRQGHHFRTQTDTEILVHGYQEWKERIVDHLDGIFSFILYDKINNYFLAARDHIGVKPLYYIRDANSYILASEIKALLAFDHPIQTLQPGHILTTQGETRYFQLKEEPIHKEDGAIVTSFRQLLEESIKKQVQTDLPIGVIFSGGLDSAAILAIARHYHNNITAFTAGFKDAPDLEIARRYCLEHGIPQHIVILDIDEIIDDLQQIIYYCENFEVIDILDACVISPVFKCVKAAGIKIVLSGEGSDEVLAGYDLFKKSPDPHYLMKYRLNNLYRTDLHRLDRCSMRYSVEARVPFLDQNLLKFAFNIPMRLKLRNGVEKWVLREALKNELPDYILHRTKERMSDGAGLQKRLIDFTRFQNMELDSDILNFLHIKSGDVKHLLQICILQQYIAMRYPMPKERYKLPNLDFPVT